MNIDSIGDKFTGPLFSSKASSRKKGSKKNKDKDRGFDHNSSTPNIFQSLNEDESHHESKQRGFHIPMQDLQHHKITDVHIPSKHQSHVKSDRHHKSHVDHHSHSLHHAQNSMSAFLSHIIPPQNNKDKLISETKEWKRLEKHAEYIDSTHLRDLIQDQDRSDAMFATHDGLYLDYSRQRATLETMDLLLDLAERQKLKEKMNKMVTGEKINFTENRSVLHTALRGKREDVGSIIVDDEDVMAEVYDVLDQIKYFTEAVRSGEIRGYTGKRLRNIISVGIGGSYLGPEFLHECLKTEPEGINKSLGYTLRFLSNVDPVDVERACADLDPEETLIVIVSKTFTTAETMLNARTVRQWLWDFMGNDIEVVKKHFVAVSSISSIEKVEAFGVDTDKYFFRFWDWVGGRYSVCSAVGGIPISLLYGYDIFEKFLQVSFSFSTERTKI